MSEHQPIDPEEGVRTKQFVLIVDSNVRDSFSTGMLLQNFGYTVTTVRSAEEALEMITIAVPTLVVMDLDLPGMSGFDLLARVRREPDLSKIPVIVQTGMPDVRADDRCRAEGCTLYLRKPVRTEDLYRAVQSTIERTPRRNLRISTYLRASVDDQAIGAELITAISDSGLFIKTLDLLPAGTDHTVSFVVDRRVIRVRAVVLYGYGFSESPRQEPGMGMKFTSIEPGDRDFLRKFIQSQVTPPGSPSVSS
jgi:CheY-like chemotaxis protein